MPASRKKKSQRPPPGNATIDRYFKKLSENPKPSSSPLDENAPRDKVPKTGKENDTTSRHDENAVTEQDLKAIAERNQSTSGIPGPRQPLRDITPFFATEDTDSMGLPIKRQPTLRDTPKNTERIDQQREPTTFTVYTDQHEIEQAITEKNTKQSNQQQVPITTFSVYTDQHEIEQAITSTSTTTTKDSPELGPKKKQKISQPSSSSSPSSSTSSKAETKDKQDDDDDDLEDDLITKTRRPIVLTNRQLKRRNNATKQEQEPAALSRSRSPSPVYEPVASPPSSAELSPSASYPPLFFYSPDEEESLSPSVKSSGSSTLPYQGSENFEEHRAFPVPRGRDLLEKLGITRSNSNDDDDTSKDKTT